MIMLNLTKIPAQAGIYRFLNQDGRLLYIGKAKNLKNRVKSYFAPRTGGQAKTAELTPAKQQMVAAIKKIQFTVVTNEAEALLLERALINKYLPPYNVDLKDDKSWLYITITREVFPRVILTRKHLSSRDQKTKGDKQQNQKGVYFGPYTSALAARQTLKMLRRMFPYYAPDDPDGRSGSKGGPMVDLAKNYRSRWHLGRYLNEPLTDKKEWLKNIRLIKKFLSGKNEEFKESLKKKMLAEAEAKNFEQAANLRDQLKYLEIINQKQQVITKDNQVDEGYLAKVKKNYQALNQLKKILGTKQLPSRIECYDISNIQGNFSVGSMAVLTDGEIDKSQYRKFKIKTVKGANDPAMIGEVIKRRLKNDWPKPDLILIDGGPTQLNAALTELKRANVKLPIISLAKRDENIYLPGPSRPPKRGAGARRERPGKAMPIKLPRCSPALQLLQQIRDEAHRFAVGYYRRLHAKNYFNS